MKMYLKDNVYEASKKRISRIFDEFENIIVAISGGKDSTVLLHISLEVAKEKGRLPLKVFFIDQEAEWSYTIDYIRYVKSIPDVQFYWVQSPIKETQSANHEHRYFYCWEPNKDKVWIRQKEPDAFCPDDIPAIHKHKTDFTGILEEIPNIIFGGETYAKLGGVTADESLARFGATTAALTYKDITWGSREKNGYLFYPLYDWTDDDVWVYIGKNHIKYNHIYDLMFNYGVSKPRMRVSSLFHETAYRSMIMLQELDREVYNRFCCRLNGVSTFSQLGYDCEGIGKLPEMFSSWKEYRDYLLEKLVNPEFQEIFKNRWKGQDGDDWYQEHVVEIMVNDTTGTKNANAKSRRALLQKPKKEKKGF